MKFTYNTLLYSIDNLKQKYPFIRVSTIGKSVQGKEIFMLEIGKGINKVLYNASHHANEWITTAVLMKFAQEYCEAYANNSEIYGKKACDIYNRTTIYIIPMVNPDGVDLVTGSVHSDSETYKNAAAMNYMNLPFPDGWKANIRGVDLNLQYPAGWEKAREIKAAKGYVKPAPRDYAGSAPLTEPESCAMFRITKRINPHLTLSYHTQGEIIYWRYLDYLPYKSCDIVKVLSKVSGYKYSKTPYESGHAGYKDWYIQEYNRPGYTIEAGIGVNPLPISQFGKIYNDNLGILVFSAIL